MADSSTSSNGKAGNKRYPAVYAVGLLAVGVIGLGLLKPAARSNAVRDMPQSPSSAPQVPLQAADITVARVKSLLMAARAQPGEQGQVAEGAPNDEPRPEATAEDYVRQAQAEPRDDAWAEPTRQLFEEDLRVKAEAMDFRIRSVECRSKSCLAELGFSSLSKARADFKAVLSPPNRPDCHGRLLLPPDGDEAKPILAYMILDCGERRAREAALATPLGVAQ